MPRALLIVDVQNDFCPGGPVPTARGAEIAGEISEYLLTHGALYDVVVASQDWHVDPGEHFSEDPDFRTSWPVHCLAGSRGAELHPDLDPEEITVVFRKGAHEAAYSAFEGLQAPEDSVATGEQEPGADAEDTLDVSLDDWLREQGVEEVDVVGIAAEHCVRATAADAVDAGYETRVLSDLVAAVDEDMIEDALEEIADAGAEVIESSQVGR